MATIRSEGGLLPADVLARIAALDRDLGGLAPSDFHLAPNERLGEAIARSWARLKAAWDAFSTDRDGLPVGDHAGRLTRERWLLPLFSELGYGRLVQQPGVEIEGKTYAVFCEYNHSPVHLVGAGVPLDRRTAGVRGAADQSPHSVVQDLLNRSTARLWGIVTNGLSLRLLRDNVTLTRQAYVEFDLEAIFATEAYEDFALLWLCAHQSRVEAEAPEDCWLERWTQAAQRDGTRALGELRSGVERAIEALGRGFLAQPANTSLHEALRYGALDGIAYYRQLLRLIYRLLFLFVAEDRDALLLPNDGTPERFDARERYDKYYSTMRLRRLSARRRGGRAHDLYEQVKLLSGWLHGSGQPALALPPLGSALWDPATTAHISAARLGNEHLLEAIRELAHVEGGRRPVDFRNLGAEELGSVYESLLELHPEIDRDNARFALTTAPGHERKQTGSYYTPTSLIGSLLETALDPVIDAALKSDDPEQALLDLTVCDPSCGSGHFLIAAANRIAKRLAAVREQDPEPPPEAIRRALRDVVSRCIHGVDVNPMAVELCKVSLWLEALEPGRPLSFLEDRIICGNSLLGTTPALIETGIPDDAYRPLLGDDKDVVKGWRQHNLKERKGQTTLRLDGADATQDAASLATLAKRQRAIEDDTVEGVRAREVAYAQIAASREHERLRLAADTWVAAFTTRKQRGVARITTGVVRRAAAQGRDGLSADELAAVDSDTASYRPLHWHVDFPAIFRAGTRAVGQHGWEGGFDCVLGNPPWEHTELKEKEFFSARSPEIAMAGTGAKRKRLIEALAIDDPEMYATFQHAKRHADGISQIIRMSERYPLCGRGRINTYAIFAEAMRAMIGTDGRLGVIVPTGIATDDTTKLFFADMIELGSLVSLYDFENALPLFEGVHRSYKFCLLTAAGTARPPGVPAEFAFFAHRVEDLVDSERLFELTADDIALLNPNTKTCPIFRTRRDAEITKGIYRRVPVLVRDGDPDGNPWGVTFKQGLFNMTTDSHLFHTRDELQDRGYELDGNVFVKADASDTGDGATTPTAQDSGPAARFLPLYEGKMVGMWDHRAASVVISETAVARQGQSDSLSTESKSDPDCVVLPRYWVSEPRVREELGPNAKDWMLVFKDVTSSTNARTMIGTVMPIAGLGHNLPLVRVDGDDEEATLDLAAALFSFVGDYVARAKVGGLHLTFGLVKQLAVPAPGSFRQMLTDTPVATYASSRALQLAYTTTDLHALAAAVGAHGGANVWDDATRGVLACEIDALMFHVYGVERHDAEYILETFPIVRRKDEKRYDEYRTKRLILEAYDRLAAVAFAAATS